MWRYHKTAVLLTIVAVLVCGQDNEPLTPDDGSGQSGGDLLPTELVIDCKPVSCNLSDIAREVNQLVDATSVTITISARTLTLRRTANFNQPMLTSVTILGSHSMITCITEKEVGLEFNSIGNVHMENLTLSQCGSSMRVSKNTSIMSAVHIRRSGDVVLKNVVISHSNGSGLNMQQPRGNVAVQNCNFTNNTIRDDHNLRQRRILGGNGVILYIKTGTPQDYQFTDCKFAWNMANSVTYNFILSASTEEQRARERGRGGGMVITVNSVSIGQRISIINSEFEENNAFLGAGLSAEIEGRGRDNMLNLTGTKFTRNGCRGSIGIGGGVYLSYEHLSNDSSYLNYSMYLERVQFRSNCAHLGGGAYFFSDRTDKSSSTSNTLRFVECTWENNGANTGSAVDLGPNFFVRSAMGYLPTPEFRDCTFADNAILTDDSAGQSHGWGTLHSSLISIKFMSSVTFARNTGSAIIIVNGIADFQHCDANFTGNLGTQGGAIFLIGTASMVVGADHTYRFVRNRAIDKGGAIHLYLVDDTDFVVSRSCFIQYKDKNCSDCIIPSERWDATLIFEGNSAPQAGHSIFATSVTPCQVVTSDEGGSRRYLTIPEDKIFQPQGIRILDSNDTGHIATEGSTFKMSSDTLQVIPGRVHDLNVKLLDDFGNAVRGTLVTYLRNSSNSDIEIDSEFSCTTDHTIRLRGAEETEGELMVQTIGSRKIAVALNVQLVPCPPAFNLQEEQCRCDDNNYVGIENCNEGDYSTYLTQGFWAGYVSIPEGHEQELATSICPAGFCTYNDTTPTLGVVTLPTNRSKLEEAICGRHRRGWLCGECSEGYTTHYHSRNLECCEASPVSCKLGWLFYVLSELVPVTLLFLFVLAFNINFNTGAVNGFILFSQLLDTMQIDASGVIKFNPHIAILSRGYQIVYGFFNLELFTIRGLSFCIWEQASSLDMLAFKYVTVCYSLVLVISVILFMRYSAARCFGKYYSITALRNSIIHGLSGFLVLCYSQCIKISFSLLYSQELSTARAHSDREFNRVFFNGNIRHLSPQHLPYAIPAVFVLVLVGVVPPLVLFGHPLLNRLVIQLKLEKSWLAHCLKGTSRLKPFFDSFQGCFKDDFRCFAGVYFFYRWPAVITYAVLFQFSLFYTMLQALLVAMLLVHSIVQPYQKRWHNVLDALLLANLIVINGITTLLYYWTRVDVGRNAQTIAWRTDILGGIQLVLIYLPLLYILLYVLARVLGKTLCKGVREQPAKEDFVLRKIGKRLYRLSASGESEWECAEDNLPYRLVGREEDNPFEQSTEKLEETESAKDTYF